MRKSPEYHRARLDRVVRNLWLGVGWIVAILSGGALVWLLGA